MGTAYTKIEIVITMGGLGSRFRRAGYGVPKYMIAARGKTLFEWSLESLAAFADGAAEYIFIALKDESADAETFVTEKCAALGIKNFRVILIDRLTDGQATTAMLASRFWSKDRALLIYNIDTYVEAGAMSPAQVRGDGFIPCFKAAGEHWSFVRLGADGRAVEVREKERISDNCTLGAYYFRTCALYERLYRDCYGAGARLVNGEKYVAPLYNVLIAQGGEVRIADIPCALVHPLGTPEELRAFMEQEI